eukprot:3068634-Amphidinium_carterae.1
MLTLWMVNLWCSTFFWTVWSGTWHGFAMESYLNVRGFRCIMVDVVTVAALLTAGSVDEAT